LVWQALKAERQATELEYVDAMRGKLKKLFVKNVVVPAVVEEVVDVEVNVVDDAVVVVVPPRTNTPVEVVVVAVVLVGTEIVPVHTAPVGQQATCEAESREQTAFLEQQEPPSAAARVEQEL